MGNWDTTNNQEEFIMSVISSKLNQKLDVYSTRSDKWCFIQLRQGSWEGALKDSFFFECGLYLMGEAYFRKMDQNCPYPEVKPHVSIVEEVCYM
jgi:hypothetical protein